MKAPHFWYPPSSETPSLLSDLLSPLSYLFSAGACLRRIAATPYQAKIPLVCIGNVVAGGAGKTPTALALAQILKQQNHKPVFVTRGYGGNGQTTCVNLQAHTSDDVGDEALLLASIAPTWAGFDRVACIRQAENHGTIIIMDDGLQNPNVVPSASFLIIDGERGIGNGHIIPAGPLRESFANALRRASAVIIIGQDKQNLAVEMSGRISKPVFRARIEPRIPAGFPRQERFVAFAGIANPQKFYDTARKAGLQLADIWDFPDHYQYNDGDINDLRLWAEEQGARLLTTEKDAVRLPPDFRDEPLTLPIALVFDTVGAESSLASLAISPSF